LIQEIQAKKVLSFHDDPFPTHWDLNPYRGCTIGCKYCFAQYSHKYLDLTDFFKNIIVKTNVSECLDKEFHAKKWTKEQIKIGGTTDIYQHSEKKYELLPKIYKIVKKYKNPIFIQTKSTLILRDFELIKDLSKVTKVDIATSISTFDENVRKIIEPGASSAQERIQMLAKFNGICRTTLAGFMPIIPLLSDTDENLDITFRTIKEYGIDVLITSYLHLRGDLKTKFLSVIYNHFPDISSPFEKLYKYSAVDEHYATTKKSRLTALRKKYNLYGRYHPVEKDLLPEQLKIF